MKKGFTLIELLAVIVILAIIALIATPIILNIIEETKVNAYARSVENIIHSSEIFATQLSTNNELELDKNIYDKVVDKIDGEKPEEGQVYINKKGEVAFSLKYGGYCYTKSYGEKSYYKEKTEETCITPFYYLRATDYNPNIDQSQFLYGPLKRTQISRIITVATNIVPEDALGSWDVTADSKGNINEDVKGKVMAWYKESSLKDSEGNILYDVYIGQEGGVKANLQSENLFGGLGNLAEIDLSNFDTSNVKNMQLMFQGCKNLTTLDLSNFDTSNVTLMTHMFKGNNNLTSLDLSGFDTSNVKKMNQMFHGCSSLKELDLSNFDTGKVTSMFQMFFGCSKLTSLDLKNFNTTNVTDMGYMFLDCKNLTTLDLSNFDTGKVTNMSYMFTGCKNLTTLDLRSFNTNKVTTMFQMFYNNSSLTEILVSNNWKTAPENTGMFTSCGTNHVTIME